MSFARLEEVAGDLSGDARSDPPASVRGGRETERGSREASSAADTAAAADAALPATRLAPPRPPAALVGRERLLAGLDAALSTPLTLVSAPAGWGKTTLLATWARGHPHRVAWLSLDASDDGPARFWTAAIAALRTRMPGAGELALAMLRSPQPPSISTVGTALVNGLAGAVAQDAPLALVLDDYQAIQDPAIHESLAFLIEYLPAGAHLLISSRVDPELPLARLRARGRLAEIRAADLRFTREDADAFLRRMLDAPLADEEVSALERRTEGWAAGLQIAALSLRQKEDRSAWIARFTGGHRYLLDYVEDEILGGSRRRSGASCCAWPCSPA